MLGYGIGHQHGRMGSVGCLVRKRNAPSERYLLASGHVLTNQGRARSGDPIVFRRAGAPRSRADVVIGRLAVWQPLRFSVSGFPNPFDVALVELDGSVDLNEWGLAWPFRVNRCLEVGMRVRAMGYASGETAGIISHLNFRVQTRCRRPGGGFGRAGFCNQVLCRPFTRAGDSGAAVLDGDGTLVGLHFAGTPAASIFQPIGTILDSLDVELMSAEDAKGWPLSVSDCAEPGHLLDTSR